MRKTANPSILVVEDMATELSKYLSFLKELGMEAQGASSFETAQAALQKCRFDVVLTDIHLSAQAERTEGLDLIRFLSEEYPSVTVIAMSFDLDFAIAEQAKRLGAWMFLRKPLSTSEELAIHLRRALDVTALRQERRRESVSHALKALLKKHPEGIIINDDIRRKVAGSVDNPDISVVITGETGTGKEEVAKLIHRLRCEQFAVPFVPVNCANLQGDLMLSTLFGHRKGAFTGAIDHNIGAVGQAHGGILFLDEFHRLSMAAQEKLLRTLNDGSYQRLGDTKESYSRFQLIAASSRDMEEAVADGAILIDLRMRLYGIEIKIPPLRERLDQMEDFVDWFFAKLNRPYHLAPSERSKLIQRCSEFYWQGNVRQLFGVLQVLAINAAMENSPIQAQQLPVYASMLSPKTGIESNPTAHPAHQYMKDAKSLLLDFEKRPFSLEKLMGELEKSAILYALQKADSIKETCEILELPRSTFDARRKKLGILGP